MQYSWYSVFSFPYIIRTIYRIRLSYKLYPNSFTKMHFQREIDYSGLSAIRFHPLESRRYLFTILWLIIHYPPIMSIEDLKRISIREFLSSRGITPRKEDPRGGMYLSPLREERTPSFSVDYVHNL